MRLMGLQAIYRAPRTSDPHPEHRVYPYLLKGMSINRSNQVWCADITYIPVCEAVSSDPCAIHCSINPAMGASDSRLMLGSLWLTGLFPGIPE